MRYRTTTLLARQSLGVAGTHIIDIPITDVISAFRFHLEVTRTITLQLAHILEAVSRIEIVDGSDVLMQLSAAQMDGLHFYERGKLGNLNINEFGAGTDEVYTAVYFGRWPFDPELAFDPKRFTNPQMRITFNAATYEANATALFLTVSADVFDEYVPSPIGFLQNREFYRYTPVASGYHYINLPTDLVLRKLIVQSHSYTHTTNQGVAAVRLDEDNMKRIPFDLLHEDWLASISQEFGIANHGIAGLREGGDYPLYHAIADWPVAVWEEIGDGPRCRLIALNGCKLTLTDVGGGEATTFIGRISGHAPHFCLCYPFGYQKDLADWYETKDIGSLRLRILNGTIPAPAPYSTRVILQQLRRY